MDDLLPIGRFARLAGLSVGALQPSLDEGREYLAADDPAHRRRLVAARQADSAKKGAPR